jgi:dynein heavy chain 1
VVDTWVDATAQNRTNIAPANIPWDMIRYLVTETYGGKIDDEGDFSALRELVHTFLTPAAFEIGHKLVTAAADADATGNSADSVELVVPAGTSLQEFMGWIQKLPEREPPTYLGLPANAEKLLLVGLGKSLIGNLKKVTDLLDEGEALVTEGAVEV